MKLKVPKKEIKTAIDNYISSFNPPLSDAEKHLVECSFKRGMDFLANGVGIDNKRIPEQYDRRKKILKSDIEVIERMYSEGYSIREIAEHFNVHYYTIYRYINPDHKQHQKEITLLWTRTHKLTPEESKKRSAKHREYKRQLSMKGLI